MADNIKTIIEDFKLKKGEGLPKRKDNEEKKDFMNDNVKKTPIRSDSLSKINENVKSILAKKINNNHTRNNSHIENKHLTYMSNHSNAIKLEPSLTLIPHINNNDNLTTRCIPNNNVIVNHNNSCFNNINIYTNNPNTTTKTNEINLKQYIIHKMNRNNNKSEVKQSSRANSTTNF